MKKERKSVAALSVYGLPKMAEPRPSSSEVVTLTEADIPGAVLNDPLECHTVPELRWWLMCRGIKPPHSWKKAQHISR